MKYTIELTDEILEHLVFEELKRMYYGTLDNPSKNPEDIAINEKFREATLVVMDYFADRDELKKFLKEVGQ